MPLTSPPVKTRAAGILYQAPDGRLLLIRRVDAGHYWAFPGGWAEDGETDEQAARREFLEETGVNITGPLRKIVTTLGGGAPAFTAYHFAGPAFTPAPCPEWDVYKWQTADDAIAEGGIYPNALTCIVFDGLDELGIARAMSLGLIESPQFIGKIALFAMRITGTGASYRAQLKEYVWRDPSLYLNEEFLQRAQGLPVVVEHPKDNILDGNYYREHVVGAIMLPYVRGEEVWGIVRVQDEVAARILNEVQLSTSPAVVFRAGQEGERVTMGEKSSMLIETVPALLDHLAICELGVWDKLNAPTGVANSITGGEQIMPESTETLEKRNDGLTDKKEGESLDTILRHFDELNKRLDAVEKRFNAKDDAEGEKEGEEGREEKADARRDDDDRARKDDDDKTRKDAKRKDDDDKTRKDDDDDKARKDARQHGHHSRHDETEEEREEKRADSARADSLIAMRKEIDELRSQMPTVHTAEERSKFVEAQSRAEPIAQAFGDSAPRWLDGESLLEYRRRLVRKFQAHSPQWKNSDISKIEDNIALDNIERIVFADAMTAARAPLSGDGDYLRVVSETDGAGRKIRRFYGSPAACWAPFKMPRRNLIGINTNRDDH